VPKGPEELHLDVQTAATQNWRDITQSKSMWPRSLSAAAQSIVSSFGSGPFVFFCFVARFFGAVSVSIFLSVGAILRSVENV
jgi:hypothetical protein